jgi:hypothetical protein
VAITLRKHHHDHNPVSCCEVFQCWAALMHNASICLVTVTVESDFLFIVLGCTSHCDLQAMVSVLKSTEFTRNNIFLFRLTVYCARWHWYISPGNGECQYLILNCNVLKSVLYCAKILNWNLFLCLKWELMYVLTWALKIMCWFLQFSSDGMGHCWFRLW